MSVLTKGLKRKTKQGNKSSRRKFPPLLSKLWNSKPLWNRLVLLMLLVNGVLFYLNYFSGSTKQLSYEGLLRSWAYVELNKFERRANYCKPDGSTTQAMCSLYPSWEEHAEEFRGEIVAAYLICTEEQGQPETHCLQLTDSMFFTFNETFKGAAQAMQEAQEAEE